MNVRILTFFFFSSYLFSTNSYSQKDSLNIKKYREDQFYFSGNYVLINNSSNDVLQSDLSSKISFGFIRDFPISKNGKWALGIGLGGSFTEFKTNLDFQTGEVFSNNFTTTKYFSSVIPFEFRWRTSSDLTYSFWRIYFGHHINYNFIDDYDILSRWNNSLSLNFGYNTWNFSVGYDLTPRIISSKRNKSNKQFKLITIGLVFYLL
tara:strand:- start:5180 stop:5797 length:618 start_codon:yes stop_codon:yes gene_type:complete